jgi:hypothetical protein
MGIEDPLSLRPRDREGVLAVPESRSPATLCLPPQHRVRRRRRVFAGELSASFLRCCCDDIAMRQKDRGISAVHLRAGRPKTMAADPESAILETTLRTQPRSDSLERGYDGGAQYIGPATVHHIWRSHRPQRHRAETFNRQHRQQPKQTPAGNPESLPASKNAPTPRQRGQVHADSAVL